MLPSIGRPCFARRYVSAVSFGDSSSVPQTHMYCGGESHHLPALAGADLPRPADNDCRCRQKLPSGWVASALTISHGHLVQRHGHCLHYKVVHGDRGAPLLCRRAENNVPMTPVEDRNRVKLRDDSASGDNTQFAPSEGYEAHTMNENRQLGWV